MSEKRANGTNSLPIGEIMQAFFQLDGPTQQEVREQVQRLTVQRYGDRFRCRLCLLRLWRRRRRRGLVLSFSAGRPAWRRWRDSRAARLRRWW